MSILKLKKNKETILNSFHKRDEEFNKKKSYGDDRYWQPVVDKSGNGNAVIRFLPGIEIPGTDEYENPTVRMWSHGFKGPSGLWYIENNRNTLTDGSNSGEGRDPVTMYNNKLWNSGDEENKKQAQRQHRKLSYISNIYVIKHPGRPEDEGKVFLFKYGQKIYDKIRKLLNPPDDDGDGQPDTPRVNVFDLWDGATFRLRIKKVKDYRNYDDSTFDNPAPLFDSDEELERVYSKAYSLLPEIAPDKFKSFEELEKRLHEVLGVDHESSSASSKPAAASAPASSSNDDMDDEIPFDTDTDIGKESDGGGDNFFARLKERARG